MSHKSNRCSTNLTRSGSQLWISLVACAVVFSGSISKTSAHLIRSSGLADLEQNRVEQSETQAPRLEMGKPIERELAGGGAHSFLVILEAGQFLRLVVDQRGIDVVVTVFGPDGKHLVEMDSPNGTKGPEPVSIATEVTGSYRVEVRSLEKDAAAGRYEVKIEELRAATIQDGARVAAERSSAEADLLAAEGGAASLRQALEKYERALELMRAADYRSGEPGVLRGVGAVYRLLKEPRKALEHYTEALALTRAIGDHAGEAVTLNFMGLVHESLGEPQKALEYYEKALPLMRFVGDRSGEAAALNNIGSVYYSLGEQRKALDYHSEALRLTRALGDHSAEVATLNLLGTVHSSLGEKQKALDDYNEALRLTRTLGDRGAEAIMLNFLGTVHSSLGEKQKALDDYNQALTLMRATRNREGEAKTLSNIGLVYHSLGRSQEALKHYNQALLLGRAVGDRRSEAMTLNNIGGLYDSLGEAQKALEYYNQALPLRRAVGDRGGEAFTLNNIGWISDSLGEKQKALEYYSEALRLMRQAGDRGGEGTTLNNIGGLYYSLGEKQKTLEYYNQALPLILAAGDRTHEATTLNNIGVVYVWLGEKQKALDYFDRALLLARAVGDSRSESLTLNNVAFVYDSLGRQQKALESLNQALPLARASGDRKVEADTLSILGLVYGSLGENETALEWYNQALALRATGHRASESTTLYRIAKLEWRRGNLPAARAAIEGAVAIIESLRTKLASMELRATYFATKQQVYALYIGLLMHLDEIERGQGNDALALNVSERARARSLLELLGESHAEIRRGVAPSLLEREQSLRQLLDAKSERQTRLLSGKHTEQERAEIEKEIDRLTEEHQRVRSVIRTTSPRYAALTQPQPLGLKEIQQQVLDSDTMLLEYALGEDHSYLWAVTSDSMMSFELPAQAAIEAKAGILHALLSERNHHDTTSQREGRLAKSDAKYRETAAALSRMILGPAAAQLGKKRLLVVADGALSYVPFAALPLPELKPPAAPLHSTSLGPQANDKRQGTGRQFRPLIEDHEIVSLPSASALAVLRREIAGRAPAPKAVAVMADPVFDGSDGRVRRPGRETGPGGGHNPEERQGERQISSEALNQMALERSAREVDLAGDGVFPRLPFSRREAEGICAVAGREEAMKALDFDASKATALSPRMKEYRIIHFATHGLLNSEHPDLSGLVFSLVDEQGKSQNGFLRLFDIYNLDLNADLVVLSACQTAMGKQVKGEGVMALTRGFMYAGAASVLASLWKVDDEGTAELMKKFYEGMLKDRLRPAAALRAAQLWMRNQKRWESPYYWAGFSLQGEFR